MRVVTFNLRCQVPADGINSYLNRRQFVFETLKEKKPDIIGFQEVKPEMFRDLVNDLDGYTVVGHGRESDLMGEHNPIAFRKDKFELYSLDVFWLSETPDVPGSRFEQQSSCPRIAVRTVLSPLEVSKPFYFYNTHLDHVGEEARVLGAKQIMADIRRQNEKRPLPAIVTGDFNAFPDDACVREFTLNGFTDATEGIDCSYHGYGKVNEPRIDYVMLKDFAVKTPAQAWTEKHGEVFLSDHYPVEVEIC